MNISDAAVCHEPLFLVHPIGNLEIPRLDVTAVDAGPVGRHMMYGHPCP